MRVELSKRFARSFKKLPASIQEKAVLRMRLFRDSDGHDLRLKVHKLHGKQSGEWAYAVDYSYRITFIFLDAATVLYLDIGTHDELYS